MLNNDIMYELSYDELEEEILKYENRNVCKNEQFCDECGINCHLCCDRYECEDCEL